MMIGKDATRLIGLRQRRAALPPLLRDERKRERGDKYFGAFFTVYYSIYSV